MNGRFLLDTNIIIALFAKDQGVHDHIIHAKEIFVPCIALGELYFGANKSQRAGDNIKRLDEFAHTMTVLMCDIQTAKMYGEIKGRLKTKGRFIPENDIWIAALARQYDLTLATKDTHFNSVAHIRTQAW